MIVEHPHIGDPYDAKGMWAFLDAQHEFVASAHWQEWVSTDTGFSRGGRRKQIVRINSAEGGSLDEMRQWAATQIDGGAAAVSIYRTWPITSGRQTGKRDNAFLERLTIPEPA